MKTTKAKSYWTFDGQSVLDSEGKNACTKTNGPLIAAAPKLLATLRQTVFALESVLMLSGANLPPASLPELAKYIEAGKCAIAEAEKAAV